MSGEFASRVRQELYHAKVLVRSVRNSTKTTAAALQDSEDRLDLLIAELETPTPEEAQGNGSKQADRRFR